jgi:hypothetical protein
VAGLVFALTYQLNLPAQLRWHNNVEIEEGGESFHGLIMEICKIFVKQIFNFMLDARKTCPIIAHVNNLFHATCNRTWTTASKQMLFVIYA